MNKISIIIPAYNEEKYIAACLEHVIKNSHGKVFEIIVVDNASTDKTSEIASSFNGVTVIRENKKGSNQARQRGFMESKGDIIANIDADTRMPEGWCEKIIEEFSKNKNIVGLSGPYIYYDISYWQSLLVKMYYICAIPLYWATGYMATGGNFAIKRTALEKMNGYDTTVPLFGDDTNTARRLSAYGKVKFTLSFTIFTSGRRLIDHGILKSAYIYISQYFSEVMLHKSSITESTDIR